MHGYVFKLANFRSPGDCADTRPLQIPINDTRHRDEFTGLILPMLTMSWHYQKGDGNLGCPGPLSIRIDLQQLLIDRTMESQRERRTSRKVVENTTL